MKRVPRPKIETELGTEILCSRCKDFGLLTANSSTRPGASCIPGAGLLSERRESHPEGRALEGKSARSRAARNEGGLREVVPAHAGFVEGAPMAELHSIPYPFEVKDVEGRTWHPMS